MQVKIKSFTIHMHMKHVQTSAGKCYSTWSPTVTSARQIIFVLHKIKSPFNWAFVQSVYKGTWCFSNLSFFKNAYLKLQGTNEAPEVGTISHDSLSRIGRATTWQEMHSAMSFNSSLHNLYVRVHRRQSESQGNGFVLLWLKWQNSSMAFYSLLLHQYSTKEEILHLACGDGELWQWGVRSSFSLPLSIRIILLR